VIDFYRELGVQRLSVSVICGVYRVWSRNIARSGNVLDFASCMLCYYNNPVLYVCICHFTHLI